VIQKEEELETEIMDADTYSTTLEEHIAFLEEFIRRANQPQPPMPTLSEVVKELPSHESYKLVSATVDTQTLEPFEGS